MQYTHIKQYYIAKLNWFISYVVAKYNALNINIMNVCKTTLKKGVKYKIWIDSIRHQFLVYLQLIASNTILSIKYLIHNLEIFVN